MKYQEKISDYFNTSTSSTILDKSKIAIKMYPTKAKNDKDNKMKWKLL